jgi:Flp pilus assembly protein CpaB
LHAWMKRNVHSFLSGKWAGKARELLPLGIGVMLTGFALATAGQRIAAVEKDIRRQANPVDIVVASVPIPVGEPFTEANLAKKPVPASGTGRRNVPVGEFQLLLGASAKNPIEPGEPILWTDVQEPFDTDAFSTLILAGRRALTVMADPTSAFAGLLLPGDRVDILAESASTGAPIWIRDIPVIAVDHHHNRLAKPTETREAATVTLMVTPQEGARISGTNGTGRLHWFLRNPVDNGTAPKGSSRRRFTPLPVEIWKGGVRIPRFPAENGGPA